MIEQLKTIRDFIESAYTTNWPRVEDRNAAHDAIEQLEAMVGEQKPACDKCHGTGYYDEGHECDDGTMAGGNYVQCEKCAAPVAQQPQAETRKADVARTCPFCNEEWVEQPQAEPDDEILKERDDAEDFIDMLLDEVLGTDRPEWTSAYGRDDALRDVQERMTALHKPTVDKAWDRFEKAQQPQAEAVPDVTDAMALAFHRALTDGAIGQSEVEDIKTGLRAAFAAAPQQAEAVPQAAEFCWLVEHFDIADKSTGHYYTGKVGIGDRVLTTMDPHQAQRYDTWRDANNASAKLGSTLTGTWRAMQHGFHRMEPQQAEEVPFNHATQLQIAYVKGLGDGAMQAEAVPPDVEVIRKALERAFIMGQNYWADADSESYSANKRSDVTRQKFNAMRDEVCAAIAQQKGGV